MCKLVGKEGKLIMIYKFRQEFIYVIPTYLPTCLAANTYTEKKF